MFIKTSHSKGHQYLSIVESYKVKGVSKHKVIASLGRADKLVSSGLENILRSLQKFVDKEKCNLKDVSGMKEKYRLNYGYLAYKKLWKQFDFDNILAPVVKKSKSGYNLKGLIFTLVINRLLNPGSKRDYYFSRDKYLEYDPDLALHQVYRSLDILSENKEKIERSLFLKNRNLFNMEIDVVFYDVTTWHYESQKQDSLRDFGFSKANKVNEVQIVMGLLIDKEGRPIGYELFPGNTFDGKTLLGILDKLKKQFELDRVIIVADKAMNSKLNLKAIKDRGYNYIVSARLKSMSKKVQQEVLSQEGYSEITREEEKYKYKVIDYENIVQYEEEGEKKKATLPEKMVCTWSSKRAAKDRKDRERAIEKAMEVVDKQEHSKVKKKNGYKRFIEEQGDKKNGKLLIDQEKIEKESIFDGYYAIEYSDLEMEPIEVLESYGYLYKIEESFKVMKSTMQTRPIYLRVREHIEGHFMICFFAFMLERELEFRLRKRGIDYSTERIKEALLSVEFSELEIEEETYYLKSKQKKLASEIFALLRIKHPQKLMDQTEVNDYVEL